MAGILPIADGRKVVASSATSEPLVAAQVTVSEVVITAETDNTGTIVVGGSTVVAILATRQGTPLAAGESMVIPIRNLQDVWIGSTINGDGVTYTYINE